MFQLRRPFADAIATFLAESRHLDVSYRPTGIVKQAPAARRFDEEVVAIGHGQADFKRARAALESWKQFDIGWVELFPRHAPVEVGTNVAVLIRHLGLWSLNGARVLYHVDSRPGQQAFGYAYGTLTNHAESGEELFEVFVDDRTGDVMYRIRAVSEPQALLAYLGLPYVRVLQARFRRHSAAAMKRHTSG